mmetsp:Transcript_2717/g.10932  ORF Transcript_2717/g.10932 Transcript_2717/m.10932 type:complete len:260 (+) Transcript_2717:2748-3527(+)
MPRSGRGACRRTSLPTQTLEAGCDPPACPLQASPPCALPRPCPCRATSPGPRARQGSVRPPGRCETAQPQTRHGRRSRRAFPAAATTERPANRAFAPRPGRLGSAAPRWRHLGPTSDWMKGPQRLLRALPCHRGLCLRQVAQPGRQAPCRRRRCGRRPSTAPERCSRGRRPSCGQPARCSRCGSRTLRPGPAVCNERTPPPRPGATPRLAVGSLGRGSSRGSPRAVRTARVWLAQCRARRFAARSQCLRTRPARECRRR